MEQDGRAIAADETLVADICIIGAGTAGITLAHTLIDHGSSVLLLESGGPKPDKHSQMLSWGENAGHPYFPLDTARPRGLGGSTNRWVLAIGEDQFGARMRPLNPIDFEKREEIPYSGWPFSKAALDPYYRRAECFCRIAPEGFETDHWCDAEKTQPLDLDKETVETVIFKFGSKEPFIKTYASEIRKSKNIRLLLHATVTGIEADEYTKNIKCVQVSCLGGNSFRVSAGQYVLACGGIENARLLLLSDKQQSTGLGNQNDLVGRFFMEHLHYNTGLFVPSDPGMPLQTALYNNVHQYRGVPVVAKLALPDSMLRREKLANYVLQLKPMIITYSGLLEYFYPAARSTGVESFRKLRDAFFQGRIPDQSAMQLRNIWDTKYDVSLTIYRNMKKRLLKHLRKKRMNVYSLSHMSEQVPNPESRVVLTGEKDHLGQNRVCLNWRFSSEDVRSALRSPAIIARALKDAGLGRMILPESDGLPPVTGGWHHMGTTRMSDDPGQGVVDSNSRVHGLSNLYIAGPSVFPTAGYANPCLTMVALTLKLSDHLKTKVIG